MTAELKVLDSKVVTGGLMEVVEYWDLVGSSDVRTAEQLFYLHEAKMRLKSIRITLNKGRCRAEPGALYHMHGDLKMKTSTGGGIMRAMSRALVSGESFFVNEIEGSGTIVLEPTYGHFILVEVSEGDAIIVDKGMFYAAIGDMDISAVFNRGTGMIGGEGLFQTQISGSGIVALFSPVPMSEIVEYQISPDKPLMVDGNFALIRTKDVKFSLTKSSKSWLSTAVSGEGLLQTFTGSGSVWIAPTQKIYEMLSTPDGLETLSRSTGSRSNNTKTKT